MTDRRRLVRGLRGEEGFSLTELLVTITLMTLISVAILASVVAVQRNLGVANATMSDMAFNRIAIERVGTLVRGATGPLGLLDNSTAALIDARADRVRLYSVTGQTAEQNPVRVELAVVGTDLVERIWTPVPLLVVDLASGEVPLYPDPPRTRVIGRNLLTPAIFTYWSHRDAVVPDPTAPADRCGVPVTTPVAAGDLSRVDGIAFRLQVQEPTGYEAAPSDLQGWARFSSNAELGFSQAGDSADCLDVRRFGYQEAYTP
jgi:type II secretory pathway pseudopilin PulG